jgi:CBS domain-containing protein
MYDVDVREVYDGAEVTAADFPEAVRLAATAIETLASKAAVVRSNATVDDAVEAIRNTGDAGAGGSAVVVEQQRPVGVITARTLLAFSGASFHARRTPVSTVMMPCRRPAQARDTLRDVLRSMCEQRIWHLPVVDERGALIGSIDVSDVALALGDDREL